MLDHDDHVDVSFEEDLPQYFAIDEEAAENFPVLPQPTQGKEDNYEIGLDYEDGPEPINKVVLKFSPHVKQVDMRKIKEATKVVIEENKNSDRGTKSKTFGEVYRRLPTLLSEKMARNLSPALGFLAVLHLCNELSSATEWISLTQSEEEKSQKDFSIKPVKPWNRLDKVFLENSLIEEIL